MLELQLPFVPPAPGFSLLLAVGLELGTAGIAGSVEPVRYTGSAKVMAVG